MRVVGRIDHDFLPEDAVAKALVLAKSLPSEPPRSVFLPAPVLLLPNVFNAGLCRELVQVHKAGPVFESPMVSLGATASPASCSSQRRKYVRIF